MYFSIPHAGLWFVGCVILFSATMYVMWKLDTKFFTGRRRKKFSAFELEFPSSPVELSDILSGIDNVPLVSPPAPAEIKKAVKNQLLVDFLFMPATYVGIFLLCMFAAHRIDDGVKYFFVFVGLSQLVAWILHIIQNIFLLGKLNNPVSPGDATFKAYRWLEGFKWGICLLSLFLALGALAYCWIMGFTTQQPLHF